MASKRPTYEEVIDGVRVRVYARRTEYECLIGDGDLADPDAEVWSMPKIGGPAAWAHQAVVNHKHQ